MQRLLQRLAHVSFVTRETLEMLEAEESNRLKWLIPRLQWIYETVDELMTGIEQ